MVSITNPSPIFAPELSAVPNITHGFFTRQGGVSPAPIDSLNCGLGATNDRENAIVNRQRCCAALGLNAEHMATPYQVHSPDVASVTKVWAPGTGPKADALVTDDPSITLGIVTADCGPVLFADGPNKVIGACHAGWRGAVTGVIENTITSMEKLGARRQNIVAVLGPTISQKNYEVGPEFIDNLITENATNERFFIPSEKEGHAMFDLPAFITNILGHENIAGGTSLGLCTYAEPDRFFSYRRSQHRGEADYGRLISIISLKKN